MTRLAAVQATGVSKRYLSREVLRGVDLVAQPGQVHGLLGPNGAGKTTLMRVLLGLVQRDGGTVRLLGCDLDSTAGPVPDGVAGLVETPSFYPYLSGRKNLAVFARLDGHGVFGRTKKIDKALEQVGLGAHADTPVAGYSAGMRQRLGLAAALIRSPRLLFLDEPTNSLDPGGAREVRALARRLAEEGAAVVLSSHDMEEVEELCSTLTVIDRGRVIFSGSVDELRMRAPAAVHLLRTSNDTLAVALSYGHPDVRVKPIDGTIELTGDIDALDAYIVALGWEGVAVRSLERRVRSLESLFLELTGHAPSVDTTVIAFPGARKSRHPSPVVS